MKACKYCGKKFSVKVLPFHMNRCSEKKDVTPVAVDTPVQAPEAPVSVDTPVQAPEAPVVDPGAKPYSEMDEAELRVLAKDRGIAAYHNKGLDKIIAELEEMDASQE